MIYSLIAIVVVLLLHVYREWVYCRDKRALMIMVKDSHQMIDQCLNKSSSERQQLLDRIQAGSFAEYKTQEVRVIKAQSGEKEPPKLEQL